MYLLSTLREANIRSLSNDNVSQYSSHSLPVHVWCIFVIDDLRARSADFGMWLRVTKH